MDSFDLGRLTDFDFEQVCKDILDEILQCRLETFTTGSDQGIDLRHLSATGTSVIVQCKHWTKSDGRALLRHLAKDEYAKVKALSPDRYVLATSLPLTPALKDKILQAMDPYITGPSDILGLTEIQAFLRGRPDIVKRHFRLWISSTAVLDSLLSKEVLLRSAYVAEEIRESLKTFAPSPGLPAAHDLLDSRNVCIISGIPGIGKTTLARILAAEHISSGFEFYEIIDPNEAFRVWNDKVPQFFYYDDFLGQTSLSGAVGSGADSKIIRLLRTVANHEGKKLVLTSREYILAQARQKSELLANSDIDLSKHILDVSSYTAQVRARILYNHLYFSRLPLPNRAQFAASEVYEPVIKHRNFNPRLVSLSFASEECLLDTPDESVERLMRNLDNPTAIWRHMFEHQLTQAEVDLTELLFLEGGEARLDSLNSAWKLYWRPTAADPTRTLRAALGALEGTLLKISVDTFRTRGALISFHNPSVTDFMVQRLQDDPEIVESILDRIRGPRHLSALWNASGAQARSIRPLLKSRVAALERAVTKAFSQGVPLEPPSMWTESVRALIAMFKQVQSDLLRGTLLGVLKSPWPDYADDPHEIVRLVTDLRDCGDHQLAGFEEPLTSWLVDDQLDAGLDWDGLRSAEDALRYLGTAQADAGAEQLGQLLFELACADVEHFSESEELPVGLNRAEEVVRVLSDYYFRDSLPGLDAFIAAVDERNESYSGPVPSVGGPSVDAELGDFSSIAEMMSTLRGS